jgi:hypothetical protein
MEQNDDHVTIRNSTAAGGGGIANGIFSMSTLVAVPLDGNSAYGFSTATLTNVTLSGNAAEYGGGILNSVGTAALTNVALSGNSANQGSGIFNLNNPTTHLTLKNSIVANSASGDNGDGQAADEALFSLWSDDSCTFTASSGNQPNTDPLLGPLADNGGSTLTHMLLPGSPAIDAGADEGAPTTDQRGLPRPSGLAYDIGAVEVQLTNCLLYVYLPVVVKP